MQLNIRLICLIYCLNFLGEYYPSLGSIDMSALRRLCRDTAIQGPTNMSMSMSSDIDIPAPFALNAKTNDSLPLPRPVHRSFNLLPATTRPVIPAVAQRD
jgi:hypothetical protein